MAVGGGQGTGLDAVNLLTRKLEISSKSRPVHRLEVSSRSRPERKLYVSPRSRPVRRLVVQPRSRPERRYEVPPRSQLVRDSPMTPSVGTLGRESCICPAPHKMTREFLGEACLRADAIGAAEEYGRRLPVPEAPHPRREEKMHRRVLVGKPRYLRRVRHNLVLLPRARGMRNCISLRKGLCSRWGRNRL
ncbi:hypothetical protein ACJJTC_017883 [Scirpophaga incertulas]